MSRSLSDMDHTKNLLTETFYPEVIINDPKANKLIFAEIMEQLMWILCRGISSYDIFF